MEDLNVITTIVNAGALVAVVVLFVRGDIHSRASCDEYKDTARQTQAILQELRAIRRALWRLGTDADDHKIETPENPD